MGGLWKQRIDIIIDFIFKSGFNVVRFPLSLENCIINGAPPIQAVDNSDFGINPGLGKDWSSMQFLDYIIAELAKFNILVVLDNDRLASSDYFFASNNAPSLWYDDNYSPNLVQLTLQTLATRHCNTWNVIGMDLFNGPGAGTTWGAGNPDTDWDQAAVKYANAVLAACPRWLVFVQGIADSKGNQGADISVAIANNIASQISNKQRLIYGIQALGPENFNGVEAFSDEAFPNNLGAFYDNLILRVQDATKVPVMVMQWGSKLGDTTNIKTQFWTNTIGNWLHDRGVSSFWYSLNPEGVTGGLYAFDWSTPMSQKITLLNQFRKTDVQGRRQGKCDINQTPTPAPRPPSPTPLPLPDAALNFTSANGKLYANGYVFDIDGVNWFGIETETFSIHGLWQHSISSYVDFIAGNGFNSVRIPLALDSVLSNPNILMSAINVTANPDLAGARLLTALDKVILALSKKRILVMLDMHRLEYTHHGDELWYNSRMTEAQLIAAWEMLATRYCSFNNVFAADIKNEPYGAATWGTGDLLTDWRLAAARIGNRILAKCPRWLIFVEGVSYGGDWGADVNGAVNFPVALNDPTKLVYSPHVYGPGVSGKAVIFNDPAYPLNLKDYFDTWFGTVASRTSRAVVIGEFGSKYAEEKQIQFMDAQVAYMKSKRIGGFYWCLNPNSGDTGGLLMNDWTAPETAKLTLLSQLPTMSVSSVLLRTFVNGTGQDMVRDSAVPTPRPLNNTTPVTRTPRPNAFTPTPTPSPSPSFGIIVGPIIDQAVASEFPVLPVVLAAVAVVLIVGAILLVHYWNKCIGPRRKVGWGANPSKKQPPGIPAAGPPLDVYPGAGNENMRYDTDFTKDDPFYASAMAASAQRVNKPVNDYLVVAPPTFVRNNSPAPPRAASPARPPRASSPARPSFPILGGQASPAPFRSYSRGGDEIGRGIMNMYGSASPREPYGDIMSSATPRNMYPGYGASPAPVYNMPSPALEPSQVDVDILGVEEDQARFNRIQMD
eukprot:CAMPEP_0184668132 /NCGR_PEP_ID=MMETSP0308-20130426/70911_1 /TAXON_ID=38269 /ORGANISM="Gloeochaete witrockiana, Strain SAG 46.84" /LENGTH=1002 /DNA_ID=CAMNT_0027113701 /DNA_START=454 /DNA_END=3462 /DNA_ORIENTATION=+